MDRLTTTQQSELISCVGCSEYDNCYGEMGCNAVYNALNKLKHYEDLESQLSDVYGECDGLLEETIKCLVEHEGLDIDNPTKTRLLTDGSVDKWLRWKELDESGRLLELPCAEGDIVYTIGWRKWCKQVNNYIFGNIICLKCMENCGMKMEYFIKEISAPLSMIANIVSHKNNPSEDFHVYLTREEAEKALEAMKNDRE